ncbi:MAG: transketolase [Thermoguttaceae bacterium]|jgi:transketolase
MVIPLPGRELDVRAVLQEPHRPKKAAMLQYMAQRFRVAVLDVLHDKGTGHWGGASSAAELLTALYFDAINVRPDEPAWPGRDRLVLSKGHASCMLYAVLAHRGFFLAAELDSFRQLDSRLQGHPCMTSTPGVDMSTGSLGHGVSVALGMALAGRLQERNYWSYVLVGEGDLDEGQTWEALMAAAKFRPPRLLLMVDYNKVQLDGPSDVVMPLDPLAEKFRAFNWRVAAKVYDGHNVADVLASLEWAKQQHGGPLAIIYRTCKGRGVSFMENNAYWHGAPVDDASYAEARRELLQTLNELEARL